MSSWPFFTHAWLLVIDDRSHEAAVGSLLTISRTDISVPTPRFAAPPRASGHQLTSYDIGDGSRAVAHDDSGRVVSDGTQGFVFDDMGALARVDFPFPSGSGAPAPKESYLYDAEGRLVASLTAGGGGEVYVSDGLQMVQSYNDGTGGALGWNATWGVGL
ncbi:MAG: hypothetical protein JNM17_25895, partial [Archangium sp.]|nr:hypothetical protein [Archangium sp.]